MALNSITLVLDLADGTGTPLATGQALLNPPARPTDETDDMIITKTQLTAKPAGSYPPARLLATDNTALRLQDGRGRSPSPGRRGTPLPFTFVLRPALTPFTATSASPAVFTAAGSSPANGTPAVLAGSSLPGESAGRPPDRTAPGSMSRTRSTAWR
jgi:hypothetical protein